MRPPIIGLVLGAVSIAHAATFTVTTTADAGPGSFRQAILDADADPLPDTIAFAIGTGPQTISPTTALPDVTAPVTIDGTTQPGFAGTPLIELSGAAAPMGSFGLVLSSHTGSAVRGLVVNGFRKDNAVGGTGILLDGGGGHTIAGTYLGTDPTGSVATPNEQHGILCKDCVGCTIGGTSAADRNLVSGNGSAGILLSSGRDNVIQGNWIGIDAAGTGALGNDFGVFILTGSPAGSTNNLVGGDVPAAANVISGNSVGITIGNQESSGNVVRGNLVGTDAAGTAVIGNWSRGIAINSGPQETIDDNVIAGSPTGIDVFNLKSDGVVITSNHVGTDRTGTIAMTNGIGVRVSYSASGAPVGVSIGGAGQGNVISHSEGAGIAVVSGVASNTGLLESPRQVDIRENAIVANGGLAIDLEDDGVTPNDPGDADDGANGLVNFPVLTGVIAMGDLTEFTGTLDAEADTDYRIELFENATPDPSGNGEAETPLGTADVTTDGSGHADVDVFLPVAVTPGAYVTATATGAMSTSELSAVFLVPGGTTTSTSTTTTTSVTVATSSTAVTTSSTFPSTTSTLPPSTTTTSTVPITTTTLPVDPCANILAGTTLASIRCRLDDLVSRIDGEAELDSIRAKLQKKLAKARAAIDAADDACASAATKRAKRRLAKIARALARVERILRSRKARSVPPVLRDEIGGDASTLRLDAITLRTGAVCT